MLRAHVVPIVYPNLIKIFRATFFFFSNKKSVIAFPMAVTRSATRHLSNTKADITKAVKVPTRSRVKTTSEEKVKESRKNASKRVKAKSTNRVQPSQNVSVKPEMQLQETVAKPVSNHISTETFSHD